MKRFLSLILTVVMAASVIPASVLRAAADNGTIALNTNVNITCKSAGNWDVRKFTPTQDGTYIFSSTGSLDTLGYIALEEGAAENKDIADDGGAGENFAVTFDMKAGTTYYLGSTVITGPVGTYTVKVVKFDVDDGSIKPLALSSSTAVITSESKGQKFLSCTPTVSGKYIFESSGSYDTMGYVFDNYWRQIAYSADGGTAQNFQITLDLEGGKTYYFGYSTTSTDTVTFNVLLYLTTYIKSVKLVTAPEKESYLKGVDASAVTGSSNSYHVELNLSGLVFQINYSNGSSVEKSYNTGSLRGFSCETSCDLPLGSSNISFTYMGNRSSFSVSVIESPVASLQIVQLPDKTVYYDEDMVTDLDGNSVFHISLYGMVIKVTYTDGTSKNLTITSAYGEEIEYLYFDYTVAGGQLELGTNTFKLTYYGKELSFDIKYSLNSDNWEFTVVDEKYIELTKYIGTDKEALVPDTLYGYPVTSIGAECFKNNTNITSVRMTDNITNIGDSAFYGCTAMTELTLPVNLSSVGANAFLGMTGVEKLNWNSKQLVYARENNVFAYLGNSVAGGTEVIFGFDCLSIPENAFYMSSTSYNANITKVSVGENVASIGNNAFRECNNLKEVEWDANKITTVIGAANNIWYNCASSGSMTVNFGEYVSRIPAHLFYSSAEARAPRLGKVTVNGKSTVVENDAFKNSSAVSCTYYCWYDDDSTFISAYDYCKTAGYTYVLLDSPVSSIYIYSQPSKLEYICGESIDLSGLTVYAVYEDNSQLDVTSKVVSSGFDNTTVGTQTVTLSFTFIDKTVTASFNILMLEEPLVLDSISVTSQPDKATYYSGDIFNRSGLAVTASYTKGFSQDVTDKVVLSDYNMVSVGTQTVLVSYTENGVTRTATFNINILQVELTGVSITSQPDNTEFIKGAAFNPDGIKVIASYNNDSTLDVTTLVTYSGYDMSALGTQTVSVLYAEVGKSFTDNYTINIRKPYLTAISIASNPSVSEYIVGGTFSLSGIKVNAEYEDGSEADVSSAVTASGYDMSTAGTQSVTVSYTEDSITKTAQFSIVVGEVKLTAINIAVAPDNPQYQNTELDSSGLKVNAVYNNGTTADVTSKVTLSGYDMTQYGDQKVYVTYIENGVTQRNSFSISVIKQTLTGLTITVKPKLTSYKVGDTFSAEGLVAIASYNNRKTKQLSYTDLSYSGYNMAAAGTQSVKASYSEGDATMTASFGISVANYETSVAMTTLPDKKTYYLGSSIDLTGMVVTAVMADGTKQTVDNSKLSVSALDSSVLGEQQISVTYLSPSTGKTYNMSFYVNVVSWLNSIEVTQNPSKTVYFYGDEFSSDGLVVSANYGDGTSKDVTSKVVLSGYSMTTCSSQMVGVSYTEGTESETTTFMIQIKNYAQSIYVKRAPTKTVYSIGDSLDLTGLIVMAKMANSTEKIVTTSVTNSGFDSTSAGEKTLLLTYVTPEKGETLTVSLPLTVNSLLTSISIADYPLKLTYSKGEELDLSGLVISVSFSDGTSTQIGKNDISVTGYDKNTVGEQTLTLTYTYLQNSASVPLTVNVEDIVSITGIAVATSPTKTVYEYKEQLDLTGMTVQLLYSNGTAKTLGDSEYSVSGFNSENAGKQTISVKYSDTSGDSYSTSFEVTVNEESEASRCDVNGDGNIDVQDVTEILITANYGMSSLTALNSRCDVDKDGSVSVTDITKLLLSDYYGKSVR